MGFAVIPSGARAVSSAHSLGVAHDRSQILRRSRNRRRHLRRLDRLLPGKIRRLSHALLDAYGPANSRASSGGESRIIRMGYGADDIYTRWSLRALPRWKEIFAEAGRPELFQHTGVLWIAHDKYPYAMDTLTALQDHKVPHERLSLMGLRKHYPQIAFDDDAWGIFEPESGVLMARRAVQTVVEQSQKIGVQYRAASALAPFGEGRVNSILKTTTGENISAGSLRLTPAARG